MNRLPVSLDIHPWSIEAFLISVSKGVWSVMVSIRGLKIAFLGIAGFFLAVSGYLLYCDFDLQRTNSWENFKGKQTSEVLWASVSVMLVGALTIIATVLGAPKGEADSSSPLPRQRFSLLQ